MKTKHKIAAIAGALSIPTTAYADHDDGANIIASMLHNLAHLIGDYWVLILAAAVVVLSVRHFSKSSKSNSI